MPVYLPRPLLLGLSISPQIGQFGAPSVLGKTFGSTATATFPLLWLIWRSHWQQAGVLYLLFRCHQQRLIEASGPGVFIGPMQASLMEL